jgi:hypothetical protein
VLHYHIGNDVDGAIDALDGDRAGVGAGHAHARSQERARVSSLLARTITAAHIEFDSAGKYPQKALIYGHFHHLSGVGFWVMVRRDRAVGSPGRDLSNQLHRS